MTPFLLATFLALLVGGSLVIVWREQRAWFNRVAGLAVALVVLVSAYVWWASHAHEVLGDRALVTLSGLTVVESAGSYRVRGSIHNNSTDRAVSAVPLHLWLEDCAQATPAAPACERLHDIEQTLVVSLPPGESRGFVQVFNVPPPAHPRLTAGGPLHIRVQHDGPRTHAAVLR